ncbi:alpha/beta hydrolase [Anaerotruncus rubiinfantis]|jgi:alpha/beta superfamily hydrolase|uniref:alpha/beta hydrolase n=1 Tax=Anaerotruncus rubiinfantis TaxID=1720200 RepID=UPI0009AC3BA0|nr:alpha/beta fold hydrolase [Anaerotruncus rubiinfantis]
MYRSVELQVGKKLLRGCVRAPEGGGCFPTVIFYHGFTVDKVGMMRLHELFARECVKNGMACVRFDFYGCGESDGDFSEMTTSSEIEDAEAIYRWTCEQDFAIPDQVIPTGHSMGGLVVTQILPKVQPKGAVIWAPAYSMYYQASFRARTLVGPTDDGLGYDIGGMKLSKAYLEDVRKLDIPAGAAGYKNSILLIHGSEDEVIPIDCAYQFQDIYGDQMELHIVEGSNHQYSSLKWKQEVYDTSIAYLKKIFSM